MSIARALSRILRNNFQMHVAWVPVATSFSLGDYGLWRDGVFAPIGNIREFGVEPRVERGREIDLQFISSRASMAEVDAAVDLSNLPLGVGTQLRFTAGQSFLIKIGKLSSTRISNIAEVARRLDETKRWRWPHKIVGELFVGEDVLLVATSERDTTISLRGVGSLAIAGQGLSASARVQVTADKQLALNITGGAGPIGLGLFRVRISGAPTLSFSNDPAANGTFVTHDGLLAEVTPEDRWDSTPEDDDPPDTT
jgi:hypothetical protein